MRIAIHKNVLVKTLRKIAPGDFKEWPEMLELDGTPVEYENDPMKDKYPDIFAALTPIEWQIFRRLVTTGFAQHHELYAYCRISLDSMAFGNSVAGHIRNLRRKLEPTKFRITTKTGQGYILSPNDNKFMY